MIRILCRHRSGSAITELPIEQLRSALNDKQLTLWVDLHSSSADEAKSVLDDIFHFHPLSVEDAIKDLHVPKVDDYGSYLYLVFHNVTPGETRMDLHTDEVDCFLGSNYLVTMHDESSSAIELCWSPDWHKRNGLARGSAMLLYELLDRQTDAYLPIIQKFEEQLEELGDSVFRPTNGKQKNADLDDLLTAKSSALRLHRVLLPQRELMHQLSTGAYAQIPNEARPYFRDVYDHQLQLSDLAQSMRDLATSTIDTHLAMASNRLNEVMKVLTILSTIFMPLTFIAGIYGMNFDYMPELRWRWSYPIVLLLFVLIALAMIQYFRRRRWL